ncbi:MAG TPA: uracil-DNA glycosylase family protein [Solirubrobacteraceae bacterium]|nr:uracil-DNA glycosylase family protein [Solirubrobacteraceae bacterium]
MPATDDEIREKYLERAIRELNAFSREVQSCRHCPRGALMPVLGSGHPQAEVFLLKYSARPSEVEEGVAFYGRSGNALMKSLKRLAIDPLAVYGTLCVKCPVPDPAMADPTCVARVVEELAIVSPKIVVVMGPDALAVLGELEIPLQRELRPEFGEIQQLTPTIDALYVPNIDEALDDEAAKRAFWAAFRSLGKWWEELPPY